MSVAHNHVGLTVRDLDRSLDFYVRWVGLDRISVGEVRRHGEWFETLTRHTGGAVRSATVGAGSFRLQLVQYHEGAIEPLVPHHAAAASPHLCFSTDDVEAAHARMLAGGWRVTPVVEIAYGIGRSFYVDDPDGVPVELLEPLR
jgi:catechol 2,3-dioxygenase-like lactoylglutathione lyase family enzyme